MKPVHFSVNNSPSGVARDDSIRPHQRIRENTAVRAKQSIRPNEGDVSKPADIGISTSGKTNQLPDEETKVQKQERNRNQNQGRVDQPIAERDAYINRRKAIPWSQKTLPRGSLP